MYTLSIKDFLNNSHMGKHITIILRSSLKIEGILMKVSRDRIKIIEEDLKLPQEILTENIENVIIGRITEKNYNRDELRRFRNIHNQLSEKPELSFSCRFKKEIFEFADDCCDPFLNQYAHALSEQRAAHISQNVLEDYIKRLDKFGNARNCNLIRILLLLQLGKYGDAVEFLYDGSVLECQEDLLRSCFFSQIKNSVGTYYWVTRYLRRCTDGAFCRDNIWWFYLRHAVQFASYEHINALLKKVAYYDVDIAIESMSYILSLNNSSLAALKLLGQQKEETNASEIEDIIDINCSFLSSDVDNYYHRYVRCIETIIKEDKLTIFDDAEMIMGYVYDFVPDRQYGFIVGCDSLSYFFRIESIENKMITNEIKKNICSLKPSNEEELVQVVFARSKEGKRTYTAIQIV